MRVATAEWPKFAPHFDYVSGQGINRLLNNPLKAFQQELSPLQNTEHGFSIKMGTDVTNFVKEIAKRNLEVNSEIKKLKHAVVLEIKGETEDNPEGHHDRTILLLEDTDGRRASVTVALHGTAPGIPQEPGEEFNPLIHKGHFGGMGIYNQKYEGLSPLIDALIHAEELSETMHAKAKSCGFSHLAGSKAIVTNLHTLEGESEAWLDSPAMQYATGMIFSKAGPEPFNGIITGSDAKQTQITIDRMGLSSRLADEKSYNIVGTTLFGFTGTAGFVEYSLGGSYEALQKYSQGQLPPLSKATIAVQGLGKIGSAALEMYLKANGKKAYVADIRLDSITSPNKKNKDSKELRDKQYPETEIIVRSSKKIWSQQVDIIAPCSTQEKIINKTIIDRLGKNGVKVVLSGANNPLQDASVADYALQKYGIAILPEVVTNNGSAITAGMEPRLLYELDRKTYETKEECIKEILIPIIIDTAKKNVEMILQAYFAANVGKNKDKRISLYQVGKELFQ